MQGKSADSVKFLQRMLPNGPWSLTAIGVDRKGVKTQTFVVGEEQQMLQWIDGYNGKWNLYWGVNPVAGKLTKKAEKTDVTAVVRLHVDVDPRAGEELDSERERALKILTNPPDGIPEPTTIVFSGGGYQAFWDLEEPIITNGDLGLAEEAELYNKQFVLAFGADHCHNIDRIMRLPGTINIPDAKKIKKGRKEELSFVVYDKPSLKYPISAFMKAQQVQMVGEKGFGGTHHTVKITGNVERLSGVDDLDEWNVPERIKVVVVQGHDPENPKVGDNSRSSWLFDCCCQLIRKGVPDDKIFAILMDPDFGISSSVLDKGVNAEKYAIRQIERAKEEVVDPWLRKLNEEFAVIENMGGKCRVIEEVMDYGLNRTRLSRQTFEDFRNRYMNQQIEIGKNKDGIPIMKSVGKWWLEHTQRRQYKTIVFAPCKEVPNAYNLWKGFACEPKAGDCEGFLTHIKTNLCSNNEEYYKYIVGWMARCVQNPDSPGQVAIVLRGKRGTGKSFFVKQFGNLFGRHFLQVADSKHLVGSFNAHLRDCLVLFGDEAFYAGDKKHESVLKMLITEEVIPIEAKGVDVEMTGNYTHLILASNEQWVVPAGADERRYFVLDVADSHKQDLRYFHQLSEQMRNGGQAALLHYLLHYDLSEFEVRQVPKTAALQEQKLLSMTPEEEWWYSKLEEGRLLWDGDTWPEDVRVDTLFEDYITHMRRYNVLRRANRTTLGRFLAKVCPNMKRTQRDVVDKVSTHDGFYKEVQHRPYFYLVPTLVESRQVWDSLFGAYAWPEVEIVQQTVLKTATDPF